MTVVERPVIIEDNLENMDIKLNDNVTLKCRVNNPELKVSLKFLINLIRLRIKRDKVFSM